jgi:hypothetical protein
MARVVLKLITDDGGVSQKPEIQTSDFRTMARYFKRVESLQSLMCQDSSGGLTLCVRN